VSDTDYPGRTGDEQPENVSIPPVPEEPLAWAPPTPDPTPQESPVESPGEPPAAPPAYQSPYGEPALRGPAVYPDAPPPSFPPPVSQYSQPVAAPGGAGVPGWLWPVVAVLSLVVGILGGAIGGALVVRNHQDNQVDGGVLKVQLRTAAPLPANNSSIPSVAAKLLPSTVKIVAQYKGVPAGAAGSGWVFDRQGHVITNNHVVADAVTENGPIDVIDEFGKHHHATVIGRSTVYDLAVLKVDGIGNLPPAAIGSSDQMNVGETVVAVGSPLALSASVTSGIISAVNRPVTTGDGADTSFINAIQTDAAINPGNSGGPLANLQGQVIGVNSALATLGSSSGSQGTNIGIGFAIPIEQVLVTADQILRTGHAEYPVIGVTVGAATSIDGARVTKINAGTPASRSDLRVGDVITAVDGRPVTDQTDVVVAVRSHAVTDKVTLTVRRGNQTLTIKVGLLAKVG
jgi:putative serine protease PepD